LKAVAPLKAMARLPVAVLAFMLDMFVYAAANTALKRQIGSDLW